MIGRTLSHYKILDEISRGGMGIVYRAVDVNLNRDVALKVLPPELIADPDRRRRFVREAQAAASLEHPHIAVIYEIDQTDGVTFIAMELLRGESLAHLMKHGLPVPRALDLAAEVAGGLAHAHDKGIAHRDLKPSNIMLSPDGHAKIIDFGLAKLLQPTEENRPALGESSEEETALRSQSQPGMILGTVSYMSPEQARAGKVDHRSDIFSFGILLYQMLTGKPPFQGPSHLDILHAILKEPTPRLPALGAEVSDEAASELQSMMDKCLEKEPEARYQAMREVEAALRTARLRLASSSILPLPSQASRKPWLFAGAAAAAALLLAGALALLFQPAKEEAPAGSSKPSVAVLYFENITGDSSLDWLRTGLTDMLVTDLSQSPQIEVLSTDRLYQILKEMNQLDERITSLEVVQEVADNANVETVILGSFMKAGDNFRINIRVQEARSGKILTTEKVEGVGESSLFSMVDDLTHRIKTKFEIPTVTEGELDRDLKDVTTSSLEAYRHYAEGIHLHERFREEEAIPHFEKAVEIDPDFAMALAKLGVIHGNLGHHKEANEYSERALEHLHRLSARERYYIEGWYYSRQEETIGAIEAYKKAVELYPDHGSARHNLAGIYAELERYDEAIEHLEELRRRRMTFHGTYVSLANAYSTRGDFDKAHQVLQEFISRNPDSWPGYLALGFQMMFWGKLDDALEALQKAELLGSPEFQVMNARVDVYILREEWDKAEAAAREMLSSPNPDDLMRGGQGLSLTLLYRGRSHEVLQLLEEASAYMDQIPQFAEMYNYAAYLYLERNDAARSLKQAQKAQGDGQERSVVREGLLWAALAQAKLGRRDEAERLAEEFRRQAESLPSERVKRRYHYLAGELALARGEPTRAIDELKKAESMLQPRGFPGEHPSIWYCLASAYMAAHDEASAREWFQRITESTTERFAAPIPYVRSFYFLGKIHENHGEMDKAREYYRRFVDFWKDGDLDRERIAEAGRKIG